MTRLSSFDNEFYRRQVIAGLAYEKLCLPWDVARRTIQLQKFTHIPGERSSTTTLLLRKLREDGLSSFFEEYGRASLHETSLPPTRRYLYNTMRTLGRAGPWGIGFLVWEVSGYGLSSA